MPSMRLAAITHPFVLALTALAIATPAFAQFGGLKKKIKQTATQETAAPADQGGTIVLTEDVVNQLLTGLRAGQAERDAAARGDTPFASYKRAQIAYDEARPKCEAAQPVFYQRAAANQKLLDKYSAHTEKMVAAQAEGDTTLMAIYQDSAMALMDPSCVVKQPVQPKDYHTAQRATDAKAEAKEIQASGFSQSELALMKERVLAILGGSTPPGGASAGEKSAVAAKSAQLKPMLGIREPPPAQAAKPAQQPAQTHSPAAAQPSPEMSAMTSSMTDCMMKNMQDHEAEIEALGERAEAAQEAGDSQKLMAIADTLQRLQMAGCR